MGLEFHHLDDADVRDAMVALWLDEAADLAANWPRGACYGKQLTDVGWGAFHSAMPQALGRESDDWLVAQMNDPAFWQPYLLRRGTHVDYNKSEAIEKLAIGEFNIAYIRGLATVLERRGDTSCVIYRASPAYQPRGECSAWEGREVPLRDVIEGHRARYHPPPGDRHAFSVPSGPNCHHSIRAVA